MSDVTRGCPDPALLEKADVGSVFVSHVRGFRQTDLRWCGWQATPLGGWGGTVAGVGDRAGLAAGSVGSRR